MGKEKTGILFVILITVFALNGGLLKLLLLLRPDPKKPFGLLRKTSFDFFEKIEIKFEIFLF